MQVLIQYKQNTHGKEVKQNENMEPDEMRSISDKKKEYIGAIALAEMLNISISTVYSWTHSRKIPFMKVGSKLVFSVEKIESWLKDNSHEPSDWWKKL